MMFLMIAGKPRCFLPGISADATSVFVVGVRNAAGDAFGSGPMERERSRLTSHAIPGARTLARQAGRIAFFANSLLDILIKASATLAGEANASKEHVTVVTSRTVGVFARRVHSLQDVSHS